MTMAGGVPDVGGGCEIKETVTMAVGGVPDVGGGSKVEATVTMAVGGVPDVGGGSKVEETVTMADGGVTNVGGGCEIEETVTMAVGGVPDVGGGSKVEETVTMADGGVPDVGGGCEIEEMVTLAVGGVPDVGGGCDVEATVTMAGGGRDVKAKVTPMCVVSCVLACAGSLMFGYDIGVIGGVISMPPFLRKFFPEVYRRAVEGRDLDSNYCKYDNEVLQIFVSILYIVGSFATIVASCTTSRWGRRLTMLIAGCFSIVGVIFNVAAQNLGTLIVGRILLGCGVGFANQVVPLFLWEMTHSRNRRVFNALFPLSITIGIFFADLINYGTNKIKGGWGWRLSLGLAGIPALLLMLGAILVVETPNSLIERGRMEEGKAVLKKIRGTDNFEPEFRELVEASNVTRLVEHPFLDLLKRKNRPQFVISTVLQMLQQLLGISGIMLYAPVVFNTLGFKIDASLRITVIIGAVNVLFAVVPTVLVNKVGRRMLLLGASVPMFLFQVVIGIILAIKVKDHSYNLSIGFAIPVIILVCTSVSSFYCSWGPLGWLIPVETLPLETRSIGQSITVCFNLLIMSIMAKLFLSMLCHLKYGIFFLFSGLVLIMYFLVYFLLPETENIPIEEMTQQVWEQHKFWKRFVVDDNAANERAMSISSKDK